MAKRTRRAQTETIKAQKRCLNGFINEMKYLTAEQIRVEAQLKADKYKIDTKVVKKLKKNLNKLRRESLSHATRLAGGMVYETSISVKNGDTNQNGETWDGKGVKINVGLHVELGGYTVGTDYKEIQSVLSSIGIILGDQVIGAPGPNPDPEEADAGKAKAKTDCLRACGGEPDPGDEELHGSWTSCTSECG